MYDKLIGKEKNAVRVLTTWQFNHYPEGPPLQAGDEEEVLAVRRRNAEQIKAALLMP